MESFPRVPLEPYLWQPLKRYFESLVLGSWVCILNVSGWWQMLTPQLELTSRWDYHPCQVSFEILLPLSTVISLSRFGQRVWQSGLASGVQQVHQECDLLDFYVPWETWNTRKPTGMFEAAFCSWRFPACTCARAALLPLRLYPQTISKCL